MQERAVNAGTRAITATHRPNRVMEGAILTVTLLMHMLMSYSMLGCGTDWWPHWPGARSQHEAGRGHSMKLKEAASLVRAWGWVGLGFS